MGRYPKTATDGASGGDAAGGGRGKTHNAPDYSAVDLPPKPATEFTYVERRAELLSLVRSVGTPDALNQSELAERYGVDQSTISRDLDRLGEHVRESVGDRDRRALLVDSTVRRCINGLMDDEEWHKAATTALKYDEWMTEFADLDRLEERLAALEADADLDGGGGW